MRWLHLSDFHVGKDNYAQLKLFKQILKHVAKRVNDGYTPDVVFITGDIANRGIDKEYSTFVTEFLDPLEEILGSALNDRLFMVPGNHDIDRDENRHFSKESIFSESTRFFDSDSSGLKDRGIILPRLKAYSSFAEKYSASWISTAKGSYCQQIEVRGAWFSIIGINTAWLSDGRDQNCITPGVGLLEDALNQTSSTVQKIVLGHHPIEEYYSNHREQIRSILGEHKAIYLHGHLHDSRVRIEDGYNFGFLSIQSGAAFQARDGDVYKNGIIWGELDLSSSSIRLQPRQWNPVNREWPPSMDLPESRLEQTSGWWIYTLPGFENPYSSQLNLTSSTQLVPPAGLQLINLEFLERNYSQADDSILLEFFNGRQPDWRSVRDTKVPRLSPVCKILDNFSCYPKLERPHVLHVLGPTGEGKTTAIMQAIIEILSFQVKWEVFWGEASQEFYALDSLLSLPKDDRFWLVVIDGADMHAERIFNICLELANSRRGDICFLISSRDSDWKAANAHRFDWHKSSVFKRLVISGLNYVDSDMLVRAWSSIGPSALGKLTGVEHEAAVLQLVEAAKSESLANDGALLGALLKVRFGDGLDTYIKSLLSRLAKQRVNSSCSLLDAFAYIAVIHALGLEILSRQVLSQVLYCSPSEIKNHVLVPLGMESAISSDGMSILTRHGEIGRRTVAILGEFDICRDQLLLNLAEAVKNIMITGDFLPNASSWRWKLPDTLQATGRTDLAIEIVHLFLRSDPASFSFLVKLSSFYRDAGDPLTAVSLFRELGHLPPKSHTRVALREWGLAEANADNQPLGLAYFLLSVADFSSIAPPGFTDIDPLLGAAPKYLEILLRQYPRNEFRQAIIALSSLGLELGLGKEKNKLFIAYLKRFGQRDSQDIDVESEIGCVQIALRSLCDLVEQDSDIVFNCLCSPNDAEFSGLVDFMYEAMDSKEYG